MGVLQIKDTGFQQMVSDLGVQSPLQGPFFGLEQVVRPVYLLGASAQVSATTARFESKNFNHQEFADPTVGTRFNVSPVLPRGRYQFKLNWFFLNPAATGFARIIFAIEDGVPANQFLYTLDLVGNTTNGRQFIMEQTEFTADILGDDWRTSWQVITAAVLTGATIGSGTWFGKYADLPTL